MPARELTKIYRQVDEKAQCNQKPFNNLTVGNEINSLRTSSAELLNYMNSQMNYGQQLVYVCICICNRRQSAYVMIYFALTAANITNVCVRKWL